MKHFLPIDDVMTLKYSKFDINSFNRVKFFFDAHTQRLVAFRHLMVVIAIEVALLLCRGLGLVLQSMDSDGCLQFTVFDCFLKGI